MFRSSKFTPYANLDDIFNICKAHLVVFDLWPRTLRACGSINNPIPHLRVLTVPNIPILLRLCSVFDKELFHITLDSHVPLFLGFDLID